MGKEGNIILKSYSPINYSYHWFYMFRLVVSQMTSSTLLFSDKRAWSYLLSFWSKMGDAKDLIELLMLKRTA
jgi:hypothetical protein